MSLHLIYLFTHLIHTILATVKPTILKSSNCNSFNIIIPWHYLIIYALWSLGQGGST